MENLDRESFVHSVTEAVSESEVSPLLEKALRSFISAIEPVAELAEELDRTLSSIRSKEIDRPIAKVMKEGPLVGEFLRSVRSLTRSRDTLDESLRYLLLVKQLRESAGSKPPTDSTSPYDPELAKTMDMLHGV